MGVKLADKICNLRDTLACAPADWSVERKRDYFEWAARVAEGLSGAHPGLEAKFDEIYARRVELAGIYLRKVGSPMMMRLALSWLIFSSVPM